MKNLKEKQRFLSSHYTRIRKLMNSNEEYKHENIALLLKEYKQVKESL